MKKSRKSTKTTSKIGRDAKTGRIVIGAERFEKISAVEGIVLTKEMRTRMGGGQSQAYVGGQPPRCNHTGV